MAKNFKNNNVERPQGYKLALQVPALATVPDLVAWLNSNFAATLAPNYGTVYTAGTANSAQNLNAAQINSLFYTKCSKSDTVVEVYTNADGEVNSMLKNSECGQFNAQFLFEPLQANVRANPVFKAGDIEYTIKKDGKSLLAGELKVGSVYLLIIDIATVTAKLVQLEITDSVVMKDVLTRLSTLETIHSKRKLLLRTPVAAGTEYNIPIELIPQIITICTYISDTGTVSAETYLDISNGIAYREYKVELFLDNGTLKMKSLQETDTGDTVQVKFSIANKTLTYRQYTTNTNAIMVVSEVFL